MASTCTTIPSPATLTSKHADVGSRSVENSRLAIAAVFIVLLPIGEAALFRARGEDDA